MNELDSLLRGLAAGLIIAVPVGPVNVLCMQRTLVKGSRSGLASGIGAALGDTLYGAVAAFSISLLIDFLVREQARIRLMSGILLALIGISYLCRRPGLRVPKHSSHGSSDLVSTLLLDLANPTMVFSFLAVMSALRVETHGSWRLTVWLVGGILCGSMSWWIVLVAVVNHFRESFDDRLLVWVNRVAGAAIGGFGVVAFVLSR